MQSASPIATLLFPSFGTVEWEDKALKWYCLSISLLIVLVVGGFFPLHLSRVVSGLVARADFVGSSLFLPSVLSLQAS